MPSFSFGGSVTSTGNYSGDPGDYAYRDGNGMVGGIAQANGNAPIRIDGVSAAYFSGPAYADIVYQGVGTTGGTTFGTSGGTFTMRIIRTSGTIYIGVNASGGGNWYWATGGGGAGTIPGTVAYSTGSTAPQSLTATAHASIGGRIDLSWTAPSNNGGAGITGYNVYTSGGTLIANLGNVTSYAHTGLTGGVSYSYVVRAVNAVSAAAGTASVNSNTATTSAQSVPTPPQSLTATASTTVVGRINLSWSAPANSPFGVTGYTIYRNGVNFASTSGTGTTYAADGNAAFVNYDWTVRARNAFADANSTTSADSNTVTVAPQGPPGAPTGLSATASLTPGRIDLAWTAPAVSGTGITGYSIYYSNGTLIANQSGTGTTYPVTGLTANTTYSFYVKARNSIADASGQYSPASNTATETALGAPAAPTAVTLTPSASVAGRLTLAWTPPAGTLTGYNIYDSPSGTLFAVIGVTSSYKIDGLTAGVARAFTLSARNTYTDTVGGEGTRSSAASGTPGASTSIATVSTVANNTNTTLSSASVAITAVTANTVSYAKVGTNISTSIVPTGAGTANNLTNVSFNGTYAIASTPNSSALTYASTGANVTQAAVVNSYIQNPTNNALSGTFTITGVDAPNKKFSYSKVAANIATVAASGTVTNNTNTTFNSTGVPITAITRNTISYAKTNANITLSNAFGAVEDVTNKTIFNGTYDVVSVPTYNTFTYARSTNTDTINVAKNPSPQVDATGWSAQGATSGARVASAGVAGGYGYRATWTADSTSTGDGPQNGLNSTSLIAPVAGTLFYPSAYVNSNVAANVQLRTAFYTSGGSAVGGTYVDSNVVAIPANGGMTRIIGSPITVPDTAGRAYIRVASPTPNWHGPATNTYTNPSFETVASGASTFRTNLCTNPNFETNTTGWSVNGGATIARDTNAYNVHTGTASLKVQRSAAGDDYATTDVTIPGPGTYTISTWYYLNGNSTTNLDRGLWVQNVGGTSVSATANYNKLYTYTWQRISVKVTVTDPTTTALNVRIYAMTTWPLYIDDVLVEQTDQLREFFDGNTTDALGFDFGWTGTANASTSTAKAALNVVNTNLCSNPNFETNVSFWSLESGATLTRDTVTPISGTASGRLTTGGDVYISTTAAAGDQFTFSVDYKTSGTVAGTPRLFVQFSGGTPAPAVTTSLPLTQISPSRFSVTSTVGLAGTTGLIAAVFLPTAGGTIWIDNVLLERGATAHPYFDGSSPASTDYIPAWTGTANASTSTLNVLRPPAAGVLNGYTYSSWNWASSGNRSLAIRSDGTGTDSSASLTTVSPAVSTTYTFIGKVRITEVATGPLSTYARNLRMNWTGGTPTVTNIQSAPNAVGVYTVVTQYVFPAAGSFVNSVLYNGENREGSTVWWDDMMLVQGAYDPSMLQYFDGGTTIPGRTTAWTGTAHASTSTKSGDWLTMDRVSTAPGQYFDGATVDTALDIYDWTSTAYNSQSTRTGVSYSRALLTPFGDAEPEDSKASLRVRYRSGWAG